jgi:pilus assembly protein CpaC
MRVLRNIPAVRLLVLALLLATLVLTPPAAEATVRAVATGVDSLEVEVNKGVLVRLPAAAAAVFVANPDYADIAVKSPTLVYVTAKRTGETSLFAVDADDQLLANINVTITHNLTALGTALRSLIPDAVIAARSIKGSIVLDGNVASGAQVQDAVNLARQFLAEDEKVINHIQVVSASQVNLRVRVAEVQRNALKRLGFNFDLLGVTGNFGFGLVTGRSILNTARDTFQLLGGGNSQAFGWYSSGSLDANSLIDALDNEGLITVLAEPNLTAISGETANFQAGGSFPIPVADGDGNISIQFKDFGILLSFTPVVLGPGRISLKVVPEVSALSTAGQISLNGFQVPSLDTRRANTTVELASGQSFAIAGLMRRDTTQNLSGTPGLANIPILGALFRSTQFQNNETELAIIVTPYLVQPAATRLATPADGFAVPGDHDRIIKGHIQNNTTAAPPPSANNSALPSQGSQAGFELN